MTAPALSTTDGVLGIDDDVADEVFSALANDSARRILTALDDEPATAPELADETGLTAQNVSYHLEKLVDANLVETDGTRGTGSHEATLYTVTESAVLSPDADDRSWLRNTAVGLVGGGLLSVICLQSLLGAVDPLAITRLVAFGLPF